MIVMSSQKPHQQCRKSARALTAVCQTIAKVLRIKGLFQPHPTYRGLGYVPTWQALSVAGSLHPARKFISGGSSSALHPYKLALAPVIGNGLRRAGSSGSRSPARRLKERGLRLTNKKLLNSDIIDRPLELNVASGNESVNTRQIYKDQDLAERLKNDEILARCIHEANVGAHSSDQSGLMLAVDLASDSIQDYITFTRQHFET